MEAHEDWPVVCRVMIPLHPLTKKNNMIPVKHGTRTVLVHPKAYKVYEAACVDLADGIVTERGDLWKKEIDFPVNLEAHYYRGNLTDVDKTNLESALCDVLTKTGVIIDDNCCVLALFDGSAVHLDRENPRTEAVIRAIPKEHWPDHLTCRKKPKVMRSKIKHIDWEMNPDGTVKKKVRRKQSEKRQAWRGMDSL